MPKRNDQTIGLICAVIRLDRQWLSDSDLSEIKQKKYFRFFFF